jgi:hypothetical protein
MKSSSTTQFVIGTIIGIVGLLIAIIDLLNPPNRDNALGFLWENKYYIALILSVIFILHKTFRQRKALRDAEQKIIT